MKTLLDRRYFVAVLAGICLTTMVLTIAPIWSSYPYPPGQYDPWLDWNDDGKIDMKDVSRVARAFGTNGTNVTKASLAYDSGWLDLRNETEETYTITHNLNNTDLQIDAREIIAGWNQTYGRIDEDIAYAVVQTSDREYAFTGQLWGARRDAWLAKIDANGRMQWNRTYGAEGDEETKALIQTSEGGYALAGYTTSYGAGDGDFWLVKTDASGNMTWNKTYGGTGYEEARGLVQTSDGGYVLLGYTNSIGAGDYDFWLVKTDENGNMQWNKTYGGVDVEYAYALLQTSDGGLALTGQTSSYGAGGSDFWLVKIDSNGTAQWNMTYGGTNNDYALALVQTGDGGYALAGLTESFGLGGGGDFWLVKTDENGTMQWNKTYGGASVDAASGLVQTSDGGYAIAGPTKSSGAGGYDYWLVKTDASGVVQWNHTYGGPNDDYPYALLHTTDGGYVMAGMTLSFGAGNYDMWLAKTDAESGLTWIDSSANTITLCRGATDTNWNYMRVRLWKPRETP